MELCHYKDETKFQEVWKRGVWLAFYICNKYGFDPTNIEQFNTHNWVSQKWKETDHTDPIWYFSEHGKTWEDFVNDVRIELYLGGDNMVLPKHEDWMTIKGIEAINELVNIPDSDGNPLLRNPENYYKTVSLAVPQWLFWVMLSRIAKKTI